MDKWKDFDVSFVQVHRNTKIYIVLRVKFADKILYGC